jgi:hypothetical protein
MPAQAGVIAMRLTNAMALSAIGASFAIAEPSRADTSCAVAPMQLQQYIYQVYQIATYWIYQGIPQNCGYNQYCQGTLLQQFNMWYQQQAAIVNQIYYTIAVTCTQDADPDKNRFSHSRPDQRPMDKNATNDLLVDNNEDKTVTIVIPDNPIGFRGTRK